MEKGSQGQVLPVAEATTLRKLQLTKLKLLSECGASTRILFVCRYYIIIYLSRDATASHYFPSVLCINLLHLQTFVCIYVKPELFSHCVRFICFNFMWIFFFSFFCVAITLCLVQTM